MVTLCAILALALGALPAFGADLPALVADTKPAIVGVGTRIPTRRPPNQLGATGFVIGDGRLVVTSSHAVDERPDAELRESLVVFIPRGEGAEYRTARVRARDTVHDVVILAIDGPPLPALEIDATGEVREGEEVFFIGFPIGAVLGLHPVTHRGIVAAIAPTVIPQASAARLTAAQIRRLRRPFDVYQLDATAYPGNSGSPLLRMSDGKVIGMVNSTFVKRTKESVLSDPSGISYAMPIDYLVELLEPSTR